MAPVLSPGSPGLPAPGLSPGLPALPALTPDSPLESLSESEDRSAFPNRAARAVAASSSAWSLASCAPTPAAAPGVPRSLGLPLFPLLPNLIAGFSEAASAPPGQKPARTSAAIRFALAPAGQVPWSKRK
eukprot:CAMPEP_0179855584 /NCGR_PEP_ID=MMETSP0982-20121206/10622_1 /TAXON_ID=483367 /ORGANISM="non described non described, Strain CCMP 2436" /LENGTH=129 /DNA_ID=CAMNT_0021741701 /DNA_START=416 /DNA_END=802 /DNA_ORIENTATION=-